MHTIDDFWDFFHHTVGVLVTDDAYTQAGDKFASARSGFVFGSKRIGPLRVRQASSASCLRARCTM